MNLRIQHIAIAAFTLGMTACSTMQMGSSEAKTEATGSAGGSQSQNASSKLERCDASLGTIAVVEDTNAPWYGILTGQYRLGSTSPVLKLMIQQSNCFVVVERGRAMNNMMQERALQQSGEMREGSNFGKGQIVAADYTMNPSINFSQSDAGGIGGVLGAFGGRKLGAIGSVVGGLKFKKAETILTMIDNRSGVQLAAAQGQARKTDFGGGIAGWGGSGYGALGGYTNTPEGKVLAAAFADAYNNLVIAMRDYRPQEVKGGLGKGGKLKVGN